MHANLALPLVTLLLLASQAPDLDSVKKEQERLKGTWTVVEAEREGQALDRIKGNQLVMEGNRFTIKTKSTEFKGAYTLDPFKKPKHLEFHHEEDSLRDKVWQAIYSLDGDDLKICYAEADSGKDRPTDFATSEGSCLLMTVLKREKH